MWHIFLCAVSCIGLVTFWMTRMTPLPLLVFTTTSHNKNVYLHFTHADFRDNRSARLVLLPNLQSLLSHNIDLNLVLVL